MKLRFDVQGTSAVVRKPISVGLLYLFAVAWNAAFLLWHPDRYWWIGAIAIALFGYGMVRGFTNGAALRFEGDRFACRNGPFPPAPELEHPIADIDCFLVSSRDDRYRVYLRTRSGATRELPIDFDSILLHVRGRDRPVFGLAPVDHASQIAEWLNEALEIARRSATQYRVGIVHEVDRSEDEPSKKQISHP